MLHLVLARGISPLIFLLLFSGHLLLNKPQYACVAIRVDLDQGKFLG